MPWVKIDDQFSEHPKVLKAGPLAIWVHIQGLCYCSRYLTDGAVTRYAADMFCNHGLEKVGIEIGGNPGIFTVGEDAVDIDWPMVLVKAGLWEVTEDGFMIHDYLKYNPSRAQVLAEREQTAKRQAKWREQHPEEAKSGRNARRNAVNNAPNNAAVTPAPYPNKDSYIQLPPDGPSEEAVTRFFKSHGRPELASDYFNARNSVGWHTNAGLSITDWPSDAKRWIKRQNDRIMEGNGHQQDIDVNEFTIRDDRDAVRRRRPAE